MNLVLNFYTIYDQICLLSFLHVIQYMYISKYEVSCCWIRTRQYQFMICVKKKPKKLNENFRISCSIQSMMRIIKVCHPQKRQWNMDRWCRWHSTTRWNKNVATIHFSFVKQKKKKQYIFKKNKNISARLSSLYIFHVVMFDRSLTIRFLCPSISFRWSLISEFACSFDFGSICICSFFLSFCCVT